MLPEFPKQEEIKQKFEECCKRLEINKEKIKELVIYELTDGTRTTTDLSGTDAYVDGGLFIMRLLHTLSVLGVENAYVLTTGEGHKKRDNFDDIMAALKKNVSLYSEYLNKYPMKMRFLGNFSSLEKDFEESLKMIESLSDKKPSSLTSYILVNYSTDWAYSSGELKDKPNANVIIKHTKGQVNEGLWLPDKLHGNSFVYVQNGSMSETWTDEQLIWLAALALRSYLLHKGRQYSKSYGEKEIEEIKKKREIEMSLVHEKLKEGPTKRVVMFSHVGPEIYEF